MHTKIIAKDSNRVFLIAVLVTAVIRPGFNVARGDSGAIQSINEKMTGDAWSKFNQGDYVGAIEKAEECIDKFKAAADRQQQAIDDAKEIVPQSSEDPKDREKIFKRGPLNDVATCLYIKAESHWKLASKDSDATAKAHLQSARLAYEAASLYSAARTFDPTNFDPTTKKGGWFWSPSQEAKDALATHFPRVK